MSGLLGDTAAFVGDNVGLLVQRILEHVQLSVISLVIAMLVALPVALVLGHTGRGGFLAINAANVGRALPSLALIAIALPFLGLNDRSTIFALVLLGIPPILTNTYVAVREVDRDIIEAARGMGMSGAEIVRGVELPLAAPVMMSGIRTAAVQIVATATLAAVIAGGGLGRFIVDGFATRNNASVVTGAVAVALLTILTELGLGAVERAVTPRGASRTDEPAARRAPSAVPGAAKGGAQ
ncbi:MAG TPA: ABC transporter permease [Actinomycetota bacterium]|nr:ABC transporter permease [Actinomycetota bacterium]